VGWGQDTLFQKVLMPHRDPEQHKLSPRPDSHGPWEDSWQKQRQAGPELEKGPITLWAR